MALYKSAQLAHQPEDEVILYQERPEPEDVIELHKPEEAEFEFHIAPLPGSEALEVFEGPVEDLKEEKPHKEDQNDLREVSDPWDWKSYGGVEKVLDWAQDRANNIPSHSGREIGGIERAMYCVDHIDKGMSDAFQRDLHGKVDSAKFEKARQELHAARERLQEAHDKLSGRKKKKAEIEVDEVEIMVKEARTPFPNGVVVSVPLLISSLARGLINGTVSNGHDIGRSYHEQIKKFNLSIREQQELLQHLEDCGYPLRRDRLLLPEESTDVSAGKGELMSNYFA